MDFCLSSSYPPIRRQRPQSYEYREVSINYDARFNIQISREGNQILQSSPVAQLVMQHRMRLLFESMGYS